MTHNVRIGEVEPELAKLIRLLPTNFLVFVRKKKEEGA
jgi:hypothetical protein